MAAIQTDHISSMSDTAASLSNSLLDVVTFELPHSSLCTTSAEISKPTRQHPAPPPPPIPSLPTTYFSPTNVMPAPVDLIPQPQEEVAVVCQRLKQFRESLQYNDEVWLSYYQQVVPVLQEGPQCGIVALSMASQVLCESPVCSETIYEAAKSHYFTIQGEMFSVEWMHKTASQYLQCRCTLIKDAVQQREYLVKCLQEGAVLLVPYDADFNHEPCCKKGHKAHWAVITGLLIITSYQDMVLGHKFTRDPHCKYLYHHISASSSRLPYTQTLNDVFVYARQGKSRHLHMWHLDSLLRSNNNLQEINPERAQESSQYRLPEGGVKAGLQGKMLMLRR